MASIFKATIKGKDGREYKAERWTIAYKDPRTGRRRKVTRFKDLAAARQYAAEIERKHERESTGLTDPFEQARKTPLDDHLDALKNSLTAKGNSKKYILQFHKDLKRIFEFTGASRLDDLNAAGVERFLLSIQKASAKTKNEYISAVKQFGNWIIDTGMYPHNPFSTLQKLNVETDRRRLRRPPSTVELEKLINAAREKGGKRGLERSIIYKFAAHTGLRLNELRTLSWGDLDLGLAPHVVIQAKNAKAKRQDTVPLRQDLAETLRQWMETVTARQGRPPAGLERVFLVPKHAERAFKNDLTLADVKSKDDSGRVLDFHGLRYYFASQLSQANVPLRTAQELMRHRDPKLTLRVYTAVENVDLRNAVEAIAAPKKPVETREQNKEHEPRFSAHSDAPERTSEGMITTPDRNDYRAANADKYALALVPAPSRIKKAAEFAACNSSGRPSELRTENGYC
jgi:integrase